VTDGAAAHRAVPDGAAAGRPLPDRDSVIAMLAAFGDRAPEAVDDVIGSLDLTWLIAEVEQRYAVVLDLTDEQFSRIRTVDDAAQVLRETLGSAADAAGPVPAASEHGPN
jgi:hypothetical protein